MPEFKGKFADLYLKALKVEVNNNPLTIGEHIRKKGRIWACSSGRLPKS